MDQIMNTFSSLRDQDILSDIDLELCRFLKEQNPEISAEVLKAACLVSYLYRQGNVCLALQKYASESLFDNADEGTGIEAPDLESWQQALSESNAIGNPGDFKPLILDEGGRLYLHRLWQYEHSLAEQLIRRSKATDDTINLDRLKEGLNHLFDAQPEAVDWQKVAAALSIRNKLSIISGGPGTGKTTTVVRVLALLLEQYPDLNIALAAPTGKAAARLKDSIISSKETLNVTDEIRQLIPDETMTLHQLLGARRYTSSFKYDEVHPVPYDVVIVDEASMVDQALMSKLMNALLDDTRLILLGDKDQLASVEAGSVLGDICCMSENRFSSEAASWLSDLNFQLPDSSVDQSPSILTDNITLLTKSYRFGSQSGIGQLAKSINAGDHERALEILELSEYKDTKLVPISDQPGLEEHLEQNVLNYFDLVNRQYPVGEIINGYNSFRILSAHRRGPWGIENLNRLVENILIQKKIVPKYKRWYAGRPVIINTNDYSLGLHNGDTGICLPDEGGQLKVYFRHEDEILAVVPNRLPDHNTAYALTVHKSQGSEFDHVFLILPNAPSKILTRELLYTAVTRSRIDITILGTASVLKQGISKQLLRSSGLQDRLWDK